MTRPDPAPVPAIAVDARVAEAVRAFGIDPGVVSFHDCWSAVDRLAPTNSPEALISAAIHLSAVTRAVPWALEDWTGYAPGIARLNDLAKLLPTLSDDWPVPGIEISHLPIYAALREHSNPRRYDHHVRALLVSVWARILHSDFPPSTEVAQRSSAAIGTLKNWITILRDNRFRLKRDKMLTAAMQDSSSVEDFALAVGLHHLEGPESKRKELTYALTEWIPQVLGLPKLAFAPQVDVVLDPPQPEPLIKVSRLRSPYAEPSNQVDDECEDRIEITCFAPPAGDRTLPPQIHEILKANKRASRIQRISSAGDHFSHVHHAALLPDEAHAVANHVLHLLNRQDSNIFLSGAFFLIALTLATGLTLDRILRALLRHSDQELPRIDSDKLHLTSILPRSAFAPSEVNSDLFLKTNSTIEIPLPPSIAKLLRSPNNFYRNTAVMTKAKKSVGDAIRQLRIAANSPALSLGRIRQTYAVRIHECSWHFPATSILSQDLFAQSDAPLYYYSASSDVLRSIYQRAIWTLFGDTVVVTDEGDSKIGSRALPTAWTTKEFARKPAAAIHQKIDLTNPTSIATAHNAIVLNLIAILHSVGGHRPNNSLFDLVRWDFSLQHCAATIADKRSDPAHARRLIGLGTMGARQLHLYFKHLEALAKLQIDETLSSHISTKVLKGREPLFFKLTDECQAEPASMEWFRSSISKAPDIPLNFGRHVLASLGRQMDRTRADLIGIHLGHYESTGYPFSADSPLVATSYLSRLNPILDKVFEDQGWRLCTGLADRKERYRKLSESTDIDWSKTGILKSWGTRKKAFNELSIQRNKKIRAHWRAQNNSIRLDVEQEVVNSAFGLNIELALVIAWRINERRQVRLKDRAPPIDIPEGKMVLDEGDLPRLGDISNTIDSLLNLLDEKYCDAADHAIAAHNTVARVLIWASKKQIYKGRQYWPYLPLRPLDPSPFIPGIFQATEQIRLLRADFDELAGRDHSEPEFTLSKAILAAIVYAGVDCREVLEGMFLERCHCWRVPAMPDALLVRIESLAYVAALRGPAAVSYAKWCQLGRSASNGEQLIKALRATFSKKPWVKGSKLIDRLTGTQEIVNRLERSPICNLALNIEEGSTSLDPDQISVLLGYAPSNTDLPPEEGQRIQEAFKSEPVSKDIFLRQIDSEIKILRELLSSAEKDIELIKTNQVFRYHKLENPSERIKLQRELEACADTPQWTWYSRLWAAWAAHELVRPKKSGPGNLALSTVRSDFHSIEKALTRTLKRLAESNRRVVGLDDLETLYQRVLEQSSDTIAANVCRIILHLHDVAVNYLNAEELDPSDYWEYYRPKRRKRTKVRNRIATAFQIEAISKALYDHSHPDADLSAFEAQDRRLILQAALAFHLAMISGARYREILTRQTRDILFLSQESALIIRPNSISRLKTRSARRLVDLSSRIDEIHRELLADQIETEKGRYSPRKHTRLWLFSTLEGRPVPSQKIRDVVNRVARDLFGRTFRWHSLRRRWVCDSYCQFFLGLSLDDLSQHSGYDYLANEGIVTPRDLAVIRHQIGHAGHRMTIETYMHMPWIFQARDQIAHWTPDRLGACIGITRESARVRLHKAGSASSVSDDLLTRFGQPMPENLEEPQRENTHLTLEGSFSRYCMALHDLGCGITQRQVRTRYAITAQEIDRMLYYSELLARRSGIGIGLAGQHGQLRLSRPPRMSASAKRAMAMWRWLDCPQMNADYMRVVGAWADHVSINRSNRSQLGIPTHIDLSVLSELKLRPVECDRCRAHVRYRIFEGKADVTSMVVWCFAATWIVAMSIDAEKSGVTQKNVDMGRNMY